MNNTSKVMSAEEAAQALGISLPALYRHIRAGRLQVVRLGRRVLILREALDRMLAGDAPQGVA